MFLHILNDSPFADMAWDIFELAFPGQNEFVVNSSLPSLSHIKEACYTKTRTCDFFNTSFLNSLKKYDIVFLHWLDQTKLDIAWQSFSNTKFVWIGWGGDYYHLIKNKPLFMNKTSALKKRFAESDLTAYIPPSDLKKINRINYFAPVLEEDYFLIKESIPEFKPKYLSWNYGSLEKNLSLKGVRLKKQSRKMLIGNSATFENNHLEAFDTVKSVFNKHLNIISPLSYGNSDYRNIIIKNAASLFGRRFQPLTHYLQRKEYTGLLSSCPVVFMNHLRQGALGNIVMTMNMGARIFLNSDNPVYSFFRKQEAFINSSKEFNTLPDIFSPLSAVEIRKNRHILKKFWSREALKKRTTALVESVLSSAG